MPQSLWTAAPKHARPQLAPLHSNGSGSGRAAAARRGHGLPMLVNDGACSRRARTTSIIISSSTSGSSRSSSRRGGGGGMTPMRRDDSQGEEERQRQRRCVICAVNLFTRKVEWRGELEPQSPVCFSLSTSS